MPRGILYQDTVEGEDKDLEVFLDKLDEGPIIAQKEDLTMVEGHPATEEELLKGIKDLPVPPQYALSGPPLFLSR